MRHVGHHADIADVVFVKVYVRQVDIVLKQIAELLNFLFLKVQCGIRVRTAI